jgi:hypothetical protein
MYREILWQFCAISVTSLYISTHWRIDRAIDVRSVLSFHDKCHLGRPILNSFSSAPDNKELSPGYVDNGGVVGGFSSEG